MTTPIIPALPDTAYLNFIRLLTPAEIVQFALNTHLDVTDELVRRGGLPTARFIHLDTAHQDIEVKFPDSMLDFIIYFNPQQPQTLQINTDNVLKAMLNVATRLQAIFGGRIGEVLLDLKKVDETNYQRLEALSCLSIDIKRFSTSVRGARMAETINKIKVTEDFILESELTSEYCPNLESVTLNNFFILWSSSFTAENLLKLVGKAKRIELIDSTLPDKAINDFIKLWLQGTERVTAFLSIERGDERKWILNNIVDGIETSKFRRENRDSYFISTKNPDGTPLNTHDMYSGTDILRADGLLASVKVHQKEVVFCVFHDPHEIRTARETMDRLYEVAIANADAAVQTHHQLRLRIDGVRERIKDARESVEELEALNDPNKALILRSWRDRVEDLEMDRERIQAEVNAAAIQVEETEDAQIQASMMSTKYSHLR